VSGCRVTIEVVYRDHTILMRGLTEGLDTFYEIKLLDPGDRVLEWDVEILLFRDNVSAILSGWQAKVDELEAQRGD
jgi:hypothetical protein